MNLYLVRNDAGVPVWIAHEDDEMRIWTYVQNTGKFHLNQGLYRDFYFEHDNTYEPITVDQAQQAIRDGVGKLDARTVGHLVDRFKADPAARSVDEILGSSPIPSVRQRVVARVRALRAAPRGTWMTWMTYTGAHKQRAYTATNNIRNGKIRAIAELGPVEAKTETVDGKVSVLIRKIDPAAQHPRPQVRKSSRIGSSRHLHSIDG